MAADRDSASGDSLRRIEVNPGLPCGIRDCGRLAHYGRIERDPRFASLWRLLPICDIHLASLDAAASAVGPTVSATTSAE